MVETGRITTLPGNDGHAFLGVDATHGLLSASDGVYPITLPSLAVGTKVSGVAGYTGDMLKIGSYVFVLSQTDGIVVLNSSTYAVVKKFGAANLAFAAGKDGAVYATNADSLIRINPATLTRTAVKLGFTVPSPWGAWRHAGISASTQDSVIYIVRNVGFTGGTQLYRYVIGNAASLTTPFITLPSGQYFYGAGAAYNKEKNELVVTTINGSMTGSINRVLIYDATTTTLKKTLTYNGWFFPAMPVFLVRKTVRHLHQLRQHHCVAAAAGCGRVVQHLLRDELATRHAPVPRLAHRTCHPVFRAHYRHGVRQSCHRTSSGHGQHGHSASTEPACGAAVHLRVSASDAVFDRAVQAASPRVSPTLRP